MFIIKSYTDTIPTDEHEDVEISVTFDITLPDGVVLETAVLADAAEKAIELISDEGLNDE